MVRHRQGCPQLPVPHYDEDGNFSVPIKHVRPIVSVIDLSSESASEPESNPEERAKALEEDIVVGKIMAS